MENIVAEETGNLGVLEFLFKMTLSSSYFLGSK